MSARTAAANHQTALVVVAVVFGMVGMSYAAVPLYRAFCQLTGFDGTTGRADRAPERTLAREITVRFDATTAPGLPWTFRPEQVSQTLKIGETGLAFYAARNLSSFPVSGRASFNVSPAKAGRYFKKIECFCFTEQRLEAGEAVDMPVSYFIDPAIADDEGLDDVSTVTLAYTFFPWDDDEAASAAPAAPAN